MKRYFVLLFALALASPLFGQEMLTWPDQKGAEAFWFQSSEGENWVFGTLTLGPQFVDVDTNSSKFDEYRDTPDGVTLPYLYIRGKGDYDYRIIAEDVGERDQQYNFFIERGTVHLGLDYSFIPHNFGNDARSLLTDVGDGRLVMSDALQAYHQQTLIDNKSKINYTFLKNLVAPSISQATYFDIGLLRERRNVDLSVGENWKVDIDYFNELRSGSRGAGTSFGFGNVVETPEPTDYLTQDLTANLQVPVGSGFVNGFVNYNDFSNRIEALTFDNPFRITDSTHPSAYSGPSTTTVDGPARGRLSLPPDSKALTLGAGMMFKFPMNSRLTANVSKGTWDQDSEFLPFTTNTAIVVPFDATNPANLPERSLDGKIDVTTVNVRFVTRPIEPLSLQARYRLYDLDNDTPRIEFEEGYVRFDAVFEEIPRISVPYSNKNDQIDLVAGWDFGTADVEAYYTRKNRDITYREIEDSTDDLIGLAASARVGSWMTLRAAYETGERSIGEYDTGRGEHASYLEDEPLGILPDLRMVDVADKDMDRLSALLMMTPGDFAITVQYLDRQDDYPNSAFGMQYADSNTISLDVEWSQSDRLNLYGFYSFDDLETFQRGRQSGATPSTDPLADWTVRITDDVDSWGLGGNFAIKPDSTFLKLFYRRQAIAGYADIYSPPGGTPDFAVPISQFDDTEFETISAEIEFKTKQNWGFAAGAWIEDYNINDAATTNIVNYLPGSFFLAGNDTDYGGNVYYIRASYRR